MTIRPMSFIGNKFIFFVINNYQKLTDSYNKLYLSDEEKNGVPFPVYCWIEYDNNVDKINEKIKEDDKFNYFLATASYDQLLNAIVK